jgi:hypothetical protein
VLANDDADPPPLKSGRAGCHLNETMMEGRSVQESKNPEEQDDRQRNANQPEKRALCHVQPPAFVSRVNGALGFEFLGSEFSGPWLR